ncbi:MAG TPA: Rab family GTPase [Thermoplasmata archaeon]|nr:Rab family GTPase [Thermoplasmata archaeon]
MTPASDVMKLKVCMAGEAMVGKTSLIRRYVLDEYEDRYTATLGTKITKRNLAAKDPRTGEPLDINLILWDIMGTPTLRDLLKEAYYHGAHGILGVADITRKETLRELDAWSRSIQTVAGSVPTYVVVNKADLEGDGRLDPETIDAYCKARRWGWSLTSAKTGAGVEDAFDRLVDLVLRSRP